MPKLKDACRKVRSKNAGPFWITLDLFFRDKTTYAAFARSPVLSPEAIGALLGVAPDTVKRFDVPDLLVVKLSYPRATPQGGAVERDMHGGQQYVMLLNVEL
ncbi:DUF4387 domain-containing protein [Sphingomonas lenta]|uniref:DUF4387 domain-containing protein n=1 Tax=Sphingomonas lenta TaxID=1141887 RepID=A0A2A2SAT2_9SPHN|nr:DUF4387 domain-containing protein [Sphingomonas lenta]PAX06359.1 hypothetical protein CKY28_17940 [Sphingomonas lenta]